ncbi:MAG TPA: hypothetical protein VHN80_08470 [Kineosporiaceae bacterium]|nr:hypothetical protein [Kineosporiaceae bacterium]
MPTIDPTTLTPDDLEPMLQAWACGTHAGEAAVGLLIRHRSWLHRRDFLRTAVDAIDDGWGPLACIVPMAAVQWDVIEDFQREAPGSSSELAILRLAASLAGATVRAPLSELTGGLDDVNARLVLDALAHRFGWHESGGSTPSPDTSTAPPRGRRATRAASRRRPSRTSAPRPTSCSVTPPTGCGRTRAETRDPLGRPPSPSTTRSRRSGPPRPLLTAPPRPRRRL